LVRSALVQPGGEDQLRFSSTAIPDGDTAVFNELAKAVTMAVEPWLREALQGEVLADTSGLRFIRSPLEEDRTQVMAWQTHLMGDIQEAVLLRMPEAHAQYLAGSGGRLGDAAALTSLLAGWMKMWFATVGQLLGWELDAHTVYLEEAPQSYNDVLPWADREITAVLTSGWTFADGGVILLEYWLPVSLIRDIAQQLYRVEKLQELGGHRNIREGIVRAYRPQKAARMGFSPVLPVEFTALEERPTRDKDSDIKLVGDVVLSMAVELGKTELSIGELLDTKAGEIVLLGKMAGEPMELTLNGHYIARGEVLVLDDRLGIRISEIISPADRLERAQIGGA
jgi:flagellar motor switch protein FliN/FliY